MATVNITKNQKNKETDINHLINSSINETKVTIVVKRVEIAINQEIDIKETPKLLLICTRKFNGK